MKNYLKDMFRSQAEAKTAAREAIWGTVPFAKREFKPLDPGTYGIHVSANVNGDLVVFQFDHYGRTEGKPLVIKRGCR